MENRKKKLVKVNPIASVWAYGCSPNCPISLFQFLVSPGRLLRRRRKISVFLLEVLPLAAVNCGYDPSPECLDELLQKRSRRTRGSFCDLRIHPDASNSSQRLRVRY
jgi:hypothetical protein